MRRLATIVLLAASLAACGGGGSLDDGNVTITATSTTSGGTTSTGGAVVGVKTLEPIGRDTALQFRLFPDVVLDFPEAGGPIDLDRDGREDAVWIDEGTVWIALGGVDGAVALPAEFAAVDVRGFDADEDGRDDLVVLGADGRLDLYVGET